MGEDGGTAAVAEMGKPNRKLNHVISNRSIHANANPEKVRITRDLAHPLVLSGTEGGDCDIPEVGRHDRAHVNTHSTHSAPTLPGENRSGRAPLDTR